MSALPSLQNKVTQLRRNLQSKIGAFRGQSNIAVGDGSQLPAVLPFKITEKFGKGGLLGQGKKGGLLGQFLTPLGEVRGQRKGGILGFGILRRPGILRPQKKMHPGIVDTATKGHGIPISTEGAVERAKGAYPVSQYMSVEM